MLLIQFMAYSHTNKETPPKLQPTTFLEQLEWRKTFNLGAKVHSIKSEPKAGLITTNKVKHWAHKKFQNQ